MKNLMSDLKKHFGKEHENEEEMETKKKRMPKEDRKKMAILILDKKLKGKKED